MQLHYVTRTVIRPYEEALLLDGMISIAIVVTVLANSY